MSDVPTSKTALGVQAYRWLVAACMGILVLLSQRTLQGIDDTAIISAHNLSAAAMLRLRLYDVGGNVVADSGWG